MSFAQYFPIWDKLTGDQQNRILSVTDFQKFKAGTVLHDAAFDFSNPNTEKNRRPQMWSPDFWSECRDSNPRPLGPEPSAIPNFATPR